MKRTKKKLRKVRQNQTRARKTSIGPTTLLSDAYSFFGPKQAESINLEKYWDRLTDLISRNDYRDADSLAKDPMLIHTTNRSLLHLASVFFNMAARSDIAITLARRGRRITMGEEPTIYSYYFLIEFGIALAAVGRVGESKQAIQRALSIRQKSKIGIEYYPTYEDECDSAIRSHFERKEYGWVIVWGLRRVLSGKPNFEVQKLVSESFSELGLFEQARRALWVLDEIKFQDSFYLTAQIHFKEKKYVQALTQMQIINLPNPPVYLDSDILDNGLQDRWQDHIRKHPQESVEAEEFIARCWYGLREWSKAEASLNFVLAIKPDALDLYVLRASIRFDQGRWQETIDDCSRVLKEVPNDGNVLVLRAKAYLMLDDSPSAEKDLSKAALSGKDVTVAEIKRLLYLGKLTSNVEEVKPTTPKRAYKGSITLLAQTTAESCLADNEETSLAECCRIEWNKHDWSRSKRKFNSFHSTARMHMVRLKKERNSRRT